MKSSFLFLFVFISTSLSLSAQFNPMQADVQEAEESEFTGKWQEYKRTQGKKERKATEVEMTDVLQLEFMPDSTTRIWLSGGKYYNEYYSVNKDGLHFGAIYHFDEYDLTENELVVRRADDYTWHYFKRVDKLVQGAIKKVVPGVEEGVVNIASSNVKGIWSTYKKEDKAFTGKKYYLRTLKILEEDGAGSYTVETSYANMRNAKTKKGTASISKSSIELRLEDEEVLTYNILKLDDNEMLLTRDGVVLYLKEFDR